MDFSIRLGNDLEGPLDYRNILGMLWSLAKYLKIVVTWRALYILLSKRWVLLSLL